MQRHKPDDAPIRSSSSGLAGAEDPNAANDWLLPPLLAANPGAIVFRRECGSALGVAVGLAAFAIAAATTIVVFFGIAFVQLRPPATPTLSQPLLRARSAAIAAMPLAGLPGDAAGNAAQAAQKLAAPMPARHFGGDAATPLPTAKRAGFTPQPGAARATGADPRAAAQPRQDQTPNDQAANDQAAGLLIRGDAFLRAGDVASARLFYERAADGGDGEAALRAGATFDPIFLASIGLRMRGDPARALDWYRRALALGASNAEPYLHRLESK